MSDTQQAPPDAVERVILKVRARAKVLAKRYDIDATILDTVFVELVKEWRDEKASGRVTLTEAGK